MEHLLPILIEIIGTAFSLVLIWFLDRFEKEPIWVLTLVFLWGAVPGILLAGVVETAVEGSLGYLLGLEPSSLAVCTTVAVAPFVEELSKAFALLVVFVFMRRGFHGVLDGIIYGAVIGMGFELAENLLKYRQMIQDYEPLYVIIASAAGVVLFGMSHAVNTAFTGLGFGVAGAVRNRWLGGLAIIAGLGAAIVVHSLNNTFVVLSERRTEPVEGYFYLGAALLLHWLLLLCLLVIIIVAWVAQWRWIKRELREEVSLGHVGERDFRQVSKWFGRLGWELRFLASFDFAGFFRIRKMFNLLVKLAFARRDYDRDPGEDTRRRLDDARRRVAEVRAKFA